MKTVLKLYLGIIMCCCVFSFKGISQYNIVPNYSFEDSVICPVFDDPLPKPWYIPSNYNSGYYVNACANSYVWGVPYNSGGHQNYQYAKSGVGYAGIATLVLDMMPDARSYLQIKLKDSLFVNRCYYVEFWINLVNSSNIATNNLALWLTKTAKYADTINNPYGLIPGNPNPQVYNYNNPIVTDTFNWVKVSGAYLAQGGEQFITIGNFKNDSSTRKKAVNHLQNEYSSYYYVDDVSVIPLDSLPLKADAGSDTTIALGDSVFIGSLTNGIPNINWYDMAGNVIDTGRPGFYVHPTTTTSYVIEQTVCGYYSRDTVTVAVNVMPLKWLEFSLTPGPSPGGEGRKTALLRWQTANEKNVSYYNIQQSYKGTNEFENVGQVMANNKPYNEYGFVDDKINEPTSWVLYRLQSIDKDGQKSYSEIRRVKFESESTAISIYPNPAINAINVKAPNCVLIEVFNADGKKIVNQKVSSLITTIDLAGQSTGLYLIKCIDTAGRITTTKFIKVLK